MKIKTIVLIGCLLSLTVIFFLASGIEQNDTNAISMYFVVFLVPTLILAVLNGLYIQTLNRLTNKAVKAIISLIPIAVLCFLSLSNTLVIPGIDGNLTFVTKVSAIALGLTNILWIVSILKQKPA